MTTPQPMSRTRFRRLMASADRPDAERSQELDEAYARGALAALLFLAVLRSRGVDR